MALDVYKDWLGIPEGDRPPDHYQLLRLIQFEDTPDKINKHYTKLNGHVRKYASGQYSKESQQLLNELAKAMLCLTDPERKREYDESLGREFKEPSGAVGRQPLEQVLVAQGKISDAQAKEAVSFADARGLSLRDAVVQLKLVDTDTAAQALAVELGRPFVDLSQMLPDDSVLDLVPRNVVKRNVILPLFVDDDCLIVACVHEPEPELEEEMRLRFGVPMRAVIATPLAVNQAISKYYATGMRDEGSAQQSASPGKGKKKQSGTADAITPQNSMKSLSADEQRERKMLGYIIMCWGIIGAIVFDELVLKPYVLPAAMRIQFVPSLTTLLAAPSVIFYVLKVFWK